MIFHYSFKKQLFREPEWLVRGGKMPQTVLRQPWKKLLSLGVGWGLWDLFFFPTKKKRTSVKMATWGRGILVHWPLSLNWQAKKKVVSWEIIGGGGGNCPLPPLAPPLVTVCFIHAGSISLLYSFAQTHVFNYIHVPYLSGFGTRITCMYTFLTQGRKSTSYDTKFM